MRDLPSAEREYPSCGACMTSTEHDGDVFYCDACGLEFEAATLEASFRDRDAEVCGHACDNTFHKPGAIYPGHTFACSPCVLPKDHTSMHWTGCELVFHTPTEGAPA